jgi:tRNA (adenine37-N6)-methyltransferase
MEEIRYRPIGIIHSPFKDIKGMPIQPSGAKGIAGTIEVSQEFIEGLKDLEGFSHIILVYHFHQSQGYALSVKPFLDDNLRGVFSTRAPRRPNPIGISVVELIKVEGNMLYIENADIVDGTPLLDIKPYVPEFDSQKTDRIGWLSGKAGKAEKVQSDQRFK